MEIEENARKTLRKYGYKLTLSVDDGDGGDSHYHGYNISDIKTDECYLGKEKGATISEVWSFILVIVANNVDIRCSTDSALLQWR